MSATRRHLVLFGTLVLAALGGTVPDFAQGDPAQGADAGGAEISAETISALFEDPAFARAMEAAEARLERARERRASEASAEARRESETAYQDQSAPEAEATAEHEHPVAVDEPASALSLSNQVNVEDYLGGHAARLDLPGSSDALAESTTPLRAIAESGHLAPVDYALTDAGTALEPKNPLAALRASEVAGRGVLLPDIDLGVIPHAANASSQVTKAGGTAFYANAYEDTDLLVRPVDGGAELSYQLRSIESPETVSLVFEPPPGSELQQDGPDIAIVGDDGSALALITPPAAWDADGWKVPVSYRVAGDALVIDIKHRAGDWRYPLLLDPNIVENQRYWHYYDGVDFTGWGNYVSPEGTPFYNTVWETHDYWGRGLYSDGFTWGWYGPYANTAWFFHAPGPESFIFTANMDLVRNNVSDTWSGPQTHLMTGTSDIREGGPWGGAGLWDEGSSWEDDGTGSGPSPLITSTDKSWRNIGHYPSAPQRGNSVLFMTFMDGSLYGSPWENFTSYLGGAETHIGDTSPPVNSSPIHTTNGSPGLPSGWVDTADFSVVTRAQDNGLGIKQFKLTVPGYAEKLRTHACVGDRTDRCPILQVYRSDGARVTGHSFTYRSASSSPTMPQGVNTVTASAKDWVGNWSANQTWQIKVDRSKPTIALSGPLWDRRGQTLTPGSYALTATASDQYSGASYVQVTVDGVDIGTDDQACPTSGGCTRTVNTTFDTDQWEPGQHTIKVVARDQVGHDADPVTFNVTVADEPAPSTMACTTASQATNFQHYSLGPAFEGQLAGDPTRRCDPTYAGEPVRANYVSYLYGTCVPLSTPGAPQLAGSCAPPVEIQSWPACERALADYELEPAVAYPVEGSTTRRGVPVYTFDGGTRVEIYADKTTIVVFGDDPAQVSRAVDAVKAEPASAPPTRPTPGVPGGNLPAPTAGALEGTFSCVAGAPLLEAPEPGATAEAPETPSVPFSWGGLDCTGAKRYPVTALFTNGVEDEIAQQTGWSTTSLGPDGGRTNSLKIEGSCVAQGADYVSGTSSPRYHMPLWTHPSPDGTIEPDGVTALATTYRETQKSCGWAVESHQSASPKQPSGFDKARRQLTTAFRPNPVGTVYWGNSRSQVQCSDSATTVVASASNGVVAFAEPTVLFGYNEGWDEIYLADLDKDAAGLVASGGSDSARIPLSWADVEPNADDQFDWSRYVPVFQAMRDHGIRPIIAAYDAPASWAADASCSTDANVAHRPKSTVLSTEWYEFVKALVHKLHEVGDAAAIEIWNEPNMKRYWGDCTPQPGRYALALKWGYNAVQDAEAEIRAGMTPGGMPDPDFEMPVLVAGMHPDQGTDWKQFLNDVKNALGSKFWDGLGLHPYRTDAHDEKEYSFANSAERQYRAARQLGLSKRIWVTEVGVTTAGPLSNSIRVGDEGAADYALARIYERLRDKGAISVIIHRLRDRNYINEHPGYGIAESPAQEGAGVITWDFSRCKSPFITLATLRDPSLTPRCP